jgi:DNA-binding NarL/FixJ family response regulator
VTTATIDGGAAPVVDARVRVMVVDDHAYVRASLERLIESTSDLRFVGGAEDGERGVAMCLRLRPAVVLMDLRLPGMDGAEATRRIARACPATSVLVLTSEASPVRVRRASEAGAVGVLLKDDPIERILGAIRAAAGVSPAPGGVRTGAGRGFGTGDRPAGHTASG